MAHVLIVDDDADIRLSMRSILEEIGGHTILEASDGLEALDILQSSEQRLVVLLDVLMPGLDGIGVLRKVVEDKDLAARHAYVLVTVSRHATSADFLSNLALDVPVVSKPFDMDVLLATVAEAAHSIEGGPGPG